LPAKLRREAGIGVGDYVEVRQDGNTIVLIPQQVAPRHPDADAVLREALNDERAGRVTPAFESVAAYRAWRKTEQGKKFAES
jgi:hypothetical protein